MTAWLKATGLIIGLILIHSITERDMSITESEEAWLPIEHRYERMKSKCEALQTKLDEAQAHIAEMVKVIETDINKTGGNLRLESLLEVTPDQSLAHVRAEAIRGFDVETIVSSHGGGTSWANGWVHCIERAKKYLDEYANELEQNG